jgi:hypothetical protein
MLKFHTYTIVKKIHKLNEKLKKFIKMVKFLPMIFKLKLHLTLNLLYFQAPMNKN